MIHLSLVAQSGGGNLFVKLENFSHTALSSEKCLCDKIFSVVNSKPISTQADLKENSREWSFAIEISTDSYSAVFKV